MGRRSTSIVPKHDDDEAWSNAVVKREPTEEELIFQQFCDCVDAHLKWKGQPPIASSDEERREKAMLYMLKSIEAHSWFAELVGGLAYLNDLLGKRRARMEVTDGGQDSENAPPKKSRFVAKVRR
jgi:hypothetical protein